VNLSATVFINPPARDVFGYVIDVPHDALWRTGVVEASFTSDGPVEVGSTGFDRINANSREMVSEWTISELEPGRLARWTLDGGPIRGFGGYICEQVGNDTEFTLEAVVTPVGACRLMGPVFRMIGRRQNRVDVQQLKQILEQPQPD
jgi:hypothetical protein